MWARRSSSPSFGLERSMKKNSGFTLVELMVGLAVGLVVSVIAISVFVSSRALHSVNTSSNRMGENSRLAFDLLHRDLRSAGYQGCKRQADGPPDSVLNAGDGGFLNSGTSGVRGHRGTGSGFAPALTTALAGISAPYAPDPMSDIISVRVPVDLLSLGLVATVASAGVPNVGANTPGNTIVQGDIVLIADCKASALFQVTEANPAVTGLLTRAVGGPLPPGNASLSLGNSYNRADTAVFRVQTRHYYVAPSQLRAGTNSLWRFTVPSPAGTTNPEEVAAGIDRLVVTYGVDTDATSDDSVNLYLRPEAVTSWDRVLSARVQMLTATTKDGTARSAQTVQFAGSSVTGSDKRLRDVLTEVIAMRSRTP